MLIHHVGILLNNDKELSAIEEILLIHVDMKERKSSPMPDDTFNKVLKMKEENDSLGELDFDLRFKIKS